jgi:hypothetical protein
VQPSDAKKIKFLFRRRLPKHCMKAQTPARIFRYARAGQGSASFLKKSSKKRSGFKVRAFGAARA